MAVGADVQRLKLALTLEEQRSLHLKFRGKQRTRGLSKDHIMLCRITYDCLSKASIVIKLAVEILLVKKQQCLQGLNNDRKRVLKRRYERMLSKQTHPHQQLPTDLRLVNIGTIDKA
ncbi:hypothetical protein [Bacillus chungangensis]|uniref:Transposase n=1 Tax=Bacillus chungangensis TaxID=587633 RepID=A0ABT9WR87_9BACI|nr:hypothetical protein [Bacillus chungangensis]MDQ0175730.1 hypothetical protein [Bacillus chungangensis]